MKNESNLQITNSNFLERVGLYYCQNEITTILS